MSISNDEIADLSHFDSETYCRNKLFINEHCEILMLNWLSGQRSKIHDHKEIACGVKVLCGEATETLFEKVDNGHIYPTQSTFLSQKSITVSMNDDIHQISNLQPNQSSLITFHIYSPPLSTFNVYKLDSDKPELINNNSDCWFYDI